MLVISYYSIFNALLQAVLKVTIPAYKVIFYYQNYALNSFVYVLNLFIYALL